MNRAFLLVAALAGSMLTVPFSAAASPPSEPGAITLVTGDQVVVHGTDVSVLPTPGRKGIAFHTYEAFGHHYVVPMDAAKAVASGRLDRRLFDVTALQQFGYDRTPDIPLLVTGSWSGAKRAVAGLSAVQAQKGAVWSALKDRPGTVWLDGKRQVTLNESVPQIGAPAAWQAGYTGKGVTVAVLDTGIDATHPDFAGRIGEVRDFTSDNNPDDTIGHGTHVASTIAGSGVASNGKYRGVAPDATLVIGKVCKANGCPDSAILAGMQWAAKERKAQVVNISLGGADTPDIDPLEAAINQLTAETGTLFVVAAGNEIDGVRQVSSPSTADAALSVGAVDKKDVEAPYSGLGPRTGDGGVKPDIAGPGTDIVAARAANSGLPSVDGQYTSLTGTSMATPHVAGAAALLAQRNPGWHANDLKAALVSSAQPTAQADIFAEGAGRVDVARAITQDVVAAVPSVNFGLQSFPHDDDPVVNRTVTYHNPGTTDVMLTLSTTGSSFSVTPTQVRIPVGGDATVTVSADTRTGPDGTLTGRLTATGGTTRITTPLTVNKEKESYNLTLTQIGRDGLPAPVNTTSLVGMDTLTLESPNSPTGTLTLRRPKGRYILDSLVVTQDEISHMTMPTLTLDHDVTVTLDARETQRVKPTVQGVNATIALQNVGMGRLWDASVGRIEFLSGITQFGLGKEVYRFYTKMYGPPVAKQDMESWVNWNLAEPGKDHNFLNSPYAYHLFWAFDGYYPTGFAPDVPRKDFAAVHQHYHAQTANKYGYTWSFGSTSDHPHRYDMPLTVTLPFDRTEYYLADGRVWKQEVGQSRVPFVFPDMGDTEDSTYQPLAAGRTYDRHWNRGVYGPAFAPLGSPLEYSSIRKDDTINVHAPSYSDGTAGRYGYGVGTKSSRIALYRDGQLVAEHGNLFDSTFPDQPPGQATYRAEVDLTIDPALLPLSNKTSVAWTFTSSHADGVTQLPLMTVRIDPALDSFNNAKANTLMVLPIRVERNPGSAPSTVARLTLESSYDDGTTWRPVPVFPGGNVWYGLTNNASPGGDMSFRVTAKDLAGNKVEQTFIHAYPIR